MINRMEQPTPALDGGTVRMPLRELRLRDHVIPVGDCFRTGRWRAILA
jgi:hypothetical protein